MRGYDILGNIALVKFEKGTALREKKRKSLEILDNNKSVKTILEKTDKFKGRLRTLKTKWLVGVKTKEVLYRENGCEFRFNIDTCYFSPRLSSERLDLAKIVKKDEEILVLFSGVGPFPIVIAKLANPKKIVALELSRECTKYAQENVKRNKLNNIIVLQGDVRKILPKMKEKFDRIVMTRPNLKDSFLDVTFPKIKRKGIIHYYGFCKEDEIKLMKEKVFSEAKKIGKKIKILRVKKAGDIGVRAYRYRIDLKVLS